MIKLVGVGLALALSLAACVTDDDVGTPPQTGDDQEDQSGSDDVNVPDLDPTKPCAAFDGKTDGPCAP